MVEVLNVLLGDIGLPAALIAGTWLFFQWPVPAVTSRVLAWNTSRRTRRWVLEVQAAEAPDVSDPQAASGHRTGVERVAANDGAPPVPTPQRTPINSQPGSSFGRRGTRPGPDRSAATSRPAAEHAGIQSASATAAHPAASVDASHGSARVYRGPQTLAGAAITCLATRQGTNPVGAEDPRLSAFTGPPPWERMQ